MKQPAKYYQYRIEWIEIAPALMDAIYNKDFAWRDFVAIGKSINYSGEYIRQIFKKRSSKMNKIVYDAIVKYSEEKFGKVKSSKKVTLNNLTEISDGTVKNLTKPPPKSNFTINTTYLNQRRDLKTSKNKKP